LDEKKRHQMREFERICYAINHFIKAYSAVPAYPENERVRAMYLEGYENAVKEIRELLNGA
jgi:hypothetical protein